jgi:hypothetical protein
MRALCFVVLCLLVPVGMNSCGPGSSSNDQSESPTKTIESTGGAPQAKGSVVAEWNGGKIYLSDVDNIIRPEQMMATYRLQENIQWEDVIAQKRDSMVDMLLDNYLLNAEAVARGLALTGAEKEAMLREFKSQFETEEEYHKHLQNANQTEEQLVGILENIQLGRKCMEDEKQRVRDSLTPDVLKAYYEKEIDKFTPPPRSMINRVVIEAKEDRTLEEAKEMAVDLHAQVQALIAAATDFAGKRKVIQKYAYQYSDTPDGSYNYGYCILYHLDGIEEAYGQEFVDEVLETPEGELSPVVSCVNGFGFFLVKEKESMGIQPFNSPPVQALLPQLIMQEKLESWRESLRENYQVKIYKEQFRLNLPEPPSLNAPMSKLNPTPPARFNSSSQAPGINPLLKEQQ